MPLDGSKTANGPVGAFVCRFSLHGACVQVELPSEGDWRDLRPLLPPGATPEAETRPDVFYRVGPDLAFSRDGELRLHAQSSDEAIDALISDLHFQLACHARTALFVHAGVVALDGRGILFPGRSHCGKSTLVAGLVEAGARYYSDEYAVLDTSGRVHPYLKPISLRDADGIGRPHSVDSLGGRCGSEPVRVALIVHTRYKPAGTWAPRPLSAAQALLAMVDNTVRAREMPEFMLEVLTGIAESASAIESDRGETGEVIRDLLSA